MSLTYSDSWVHSINLATLCLRREDAGIFLDVSIEYLSFLAKQLERLQDDSDADELSLPPSFNPIDWDEFRRQYERTSGSRLAQFPKISFYNNENELDCRRILIRILTSQSECFAFKSSVLSRSQLWNLGAIQYQFSLEKIHSALDIADTQICKWFSELEHPPQSVKKHLEEDADIVSVAIESLTKNRDKFLHFSKKEAEFLLRKLKPQWSSRDKVKSSWGNDKWKSNPTPKLDYAAQRKEFEDRFKDVQNAISVLETMDERLSEMKEKSKILKNQISGDFNLPFKSQTDYERRYNGCRPSIEATSRRVSLEDFPDPADFGWVFTGSWDYVEFFEKDDVKLDWYYTTTTIKTSLNHPTQGKTQLFRRNITPEEYRSILVNPRMHTVKGYKKKNQRRG